MKKFFLNLVLLSNLILLLPIHSKATSATLSPQSFEYLASGAEFLSRAGLFDCGAGSYWDYFSSNYEYIISSELGSSDPSVINSFTDVTVQDIPYDVIEKYANENLYDHEGNIVTFEDGDGFGNMGIRYATFDNGYYHGSCLIDGDGYIIYILDSEENIRPLADIAYGGSSVSASGMESAFSNIGDDVRANDYNIGTVSGAQSTYYLCYGQTRYGSPAQVESVFITNQYIPGLIIPKQTTNGGQIQSWYTNELSLIQHTVLMGWGTLTVSNGPYVVGGRSYSYLVEFATGIGFDISVSTNPSLSDFLNGITPGSGVFCFGKSGYYFSSSLMNDSTPFYPTDGASIDYTGSYAIADVIGGVAEWEDTDRSPSMSFDPTLPITADNYPVVAPIDRPITADPSLALDPDIPYEDDPAIEEELPGIVTIPDGGFDIPILSNLQNRFPFSIPWDIKNLLKSLRARAVAPRFQADLYIRPIDYTYHIDLDLSMFDTQAEIFRTCFLISFIIGLCLFSYSHFFGH